MWPSAWGADVVINRLRAKGFTHAFRHLALPGTGHWTPLPNTVTTFSSAAVHSLTPIFFAFGGTPAAIARESRDTWNAMRAHYGEMFGD
jgi:acyl-coenzyme A thioesterase 1/2/4